MKKIPFVPRSSKYDAPPGWTPTNIHGKNEWRCKEIQFNFKYNEYRRCSHSCEKRYIQYHKNKHVYDIPQKEDPDFPENIISKIQNNTYDQFNKRYVQELALLCGKLDISFKKGASQSLRNFSIFLLKEGQQITKGTCDSVNFDKFLNNVSDKKIADEIINVSQIEFDKKIIDFQKKKYCCLLCDAGTVIRSHILHFVIACFYDHTKYLLYDSKNCESNDSEFYFKCFSDVIENLRSDGIEICSITTDSLPAQVSGWNDFISTSEDPLISSLYRIPCYAHMINLVFLNSTKKSIKLQQIINSVLEISKLIRKKDAIDFIRCKCPTFSPTRWIYIVDILLFLLSKKTEINNFIQIKNNEGLEQYDLINEDMEFAYQVLILLKLFSLIVEKNNFQLYNIVLLVREFYTELNNVYVSTENPDYKEIVNIIDASFRAKCLNNAYNETVTAYVLSSCGRAEIRKKYESIRTINPGSLSFTTPFETLRQERIQFEHRQTPLITDVILQESFSIYDENDIQDEFNEQILKFDENKDSGSNDTYNEIINEPFEKRIKQDIFRNLYQIAKSELIEKGKILDISDEYIEEMLDIFLFEDPRKLDFMRYSQENPYLFWRKTYCFDEQWEIFSDLALRYESSFSSEAIVERFLSIQKAIQNDRMSNVSVPVVKSRLRLHELAKDDDE